MSYANYRRHSASPLPTIPHLWAEARRLFARALANVGEPREIARRANLPRSMRREIVLWVEPVEKMVRGLIAARAVIHLLMTPEGRKLLREAKRVYPEPEPEIEAPRPRPGSTVRTIRIPHPGWHTIWQPPQKPAPPSPQPEAVPEAALPDPGDPSSWSCPYRVVSRIAAPASRVMPEPRRGPRITLLDDWVAPPRPKPAAPPPDPAGADSAGDDSGDDDSANGVKLAFRYARRIEALRRVIDNPGPAIRRLARVLAKAAPDDVELLRWKNEAARRRWLTWRQGDLYADQTREHALLAVRALHLSLEWIDRPTHEPG